MMIGNDAVATATDVLNQGTQSEFVGFGVDQSQQQQWEPEEFVNENW